jgi:hypothetical protein
MLFLFGFEKLVHSYANKVLEVTDDFLFAVWIRAAERKGYTDFLYNYIY